MPPGSPAVTIVVVPREQFSKTKASLESIYANTAMPFSLVYVDGASPPHVARYLRDRARTRGFTLLREERFLAGNEARELARPYVRTPYIAYLDNDVAVQPGWLERLVACAEETGAWIVGPLYLAGDPRDGMIHTLGGDLAIEERDGARRLRERHRFAGLPVARVADRLVRAPIDFVEFHCLLARTDAIARLGGLDVELLSYLDHLDVCLSARAAGGSVWSQPEARVSHLAPPPLALYDLRFYLLRWSARWLRHSIRRFAATWHLDPNDRAFVTHLEYQRDRRRRLMRGSRHWERLFGRSRYRALEDRLNAALDVAVAGPAPLADR